MKEATGMLELGLYTECPHCEEHIDLMNETDCFETGKADPPNACTIVYDFVFNRPLEPMVCTCGYCDKKFILQSVEY